MGKDKDKIKWMESPEEHNYPAAESYLSLLFDDGVVTRLVEDLEKCKIKEFKAKDIFRSSRLSLLGISNSHVDKNIDKIEDGKDLSPILLIRDPRERMVIVADGYHRLCAVYHYDEDALIPCKIATL